MPLFSHVPVLAEAVVDAGRQLPRSEGLLIDATLGGGGHSALLLEQHPGLRLVVTLDGEDVVDCEPVIGYLHRGMEKIAENRTNVMFVPYVSRMDYAAGMFYEAVVVNAPEKLADIPVPKRASYIRVLMLELNRIANHLLWLGPFLADVGAQTPFFYIFREREMIYDLWEAATGQRLINNNYFRIGGVAADLPWGWLEKCRDFCDWFGPKIKLYLNYFFNTLKN